MKTTGIKMNGYRLTVIGLLLCTMTMQAVAVDYKNQYKHSVVNHQYSDNGIEAAVPSTGFRSTSAYSGQWNQDAQQSMLNADGSMNTDAYMVSGPRRAPGDGPGSSPGTPGGTLDPNAQQPLGDGLLVLMLMAVAYMGIRLRKRAING